MKPADTAAFLNATDRVAGSLRPADAYILAMVDEVQKREHIGGNLFEIGAQDGKTAILLARAATPDEVIGVCDLFESGRDSFVANMRVHTSLAPERLNVFQHRSASLTADETTSRVRLFHVASAYRAEDVFVDLVTADRAVLPDGVVALDSLFDPLMPFVSEAFYNFVASRPTAFVPIFIGANTVFLTRPDAAVQYEQHWTDVLGGVPLAVDWREWLGRRVLAAMRRPARQPPGTLTDRLRRLIGR